MVFLMSALSAILLWPGVWYIGCAYAIAAQVFVLICVTMDLDQYIATAARLGTAASVSNTLLSIIVWKSIGNVMYAFLAGIRAAVVTAVSIAMIVASESLHASHSARMEGSMVDSDDDDDSTGATNKVQQARTAPYQAAPEHNAAAEELPEEGSKTAVQRAEELSDAAPLLLRKRRENLY